MILLTRLTPLLQVLEDDIAKRVDTGSAHGTDENGCDATTGVNCPAGIMSTPIDLVVHKNLRHVRRTDLGEDRSDGGNLFVAVWSRPVHNMEQEIGLGCLLERGGKSLDELMREPTDKTHRVRDDALDSGIGSDPSRQRVQRREQLIRGIGARTRQRVEQGRFPGVGVAHQRNRKRRSAIPGPPLGPALPPERIDLLSQASNPFAEHSAVELELSLARSAPNTNAAPLAFKVGPPAHQAGRKMFEPRELDLQLADVATRPAGENIEDELGTVKHW